jgi:hypothetical protein
MDTFLLNLHSGIRWLLVVVTVITLGKLIIGVVQKRAYDDVAVRLMRAFTIVIDLQWLVGLILFLVLDSFKVGFRWEHALTMTIAVAVAHVSMRWRKSPDAIRYRNDLIVVIAVLMIVFIGVARLPQGWI